MDMNFTQEQLQALANLGISDDKLQELKAKWGNAYDRSQQYGIPGTHTGQTYVAASPLQHIGQAVQRWRARNEMKKLQGQMGTERGNIAATRGDMIRRLQPSQMGIPGATPGISPTPNRGQSAEALMSQYMRGTGY